MKKKKEIQKLIYAKLISNPMQNTKHGHCNFRCQGRRKVNTKQATKKPRKLAELSIRRRLVSAGRTARRRPLHDNTAGVLSISTLQYAPRVQLRQTLIRQRCGLLGIPDIKNCFPSWGTQRTEPWPCMAP